MLASHRGSSGGEPQILHAIKIPRRDLLLLVLKGRYEVLSVHPSATLRHGEVHLDVSIVLGVDIEAVLPVGCQRAHRVFLRRGDQRERHHLNESLNSSLSPKKLCGTLS